MDALYVVELFGGLRVVCRDGTGRPPITRFRTQKTGLLLAYLAHHNKRLHAREPLVEMLWPDSPIEQGRQGLSMALSSLRAQLEPPGTGILPGTVLVADRNSIGVSAAVTTDTALFETLLDSLADESNEEARAELVTEATRLYHNQLLPGFYDDWIMPEQERLNYRWHGFQKRFLRHAELNRPFVEALPRAGKTNPSAFENASAGKEHFPRSRKMRGSQDSRSTRIAIASVQNATKMSTPTDRTPLPPSPSVNESGIPPLVIPLTRFFGRESELQHISDWIVDPTVRQVTITGPGGIGKTRLIREAVRRIRDAVVPADSRTPHPDVFVADLSTLTEVNQLDGALRSALGISAGTAPAPDREREVEVLNAKSIPVLVLDNMEQLLPDGADWVEMLLARVPALTCVVTSRCRLQIEGEHELPVQPLPYPQKEAPTYDDNQDGPVALLQDWPGVALFVDRARLARPDFALTRRNVSDIVNLVACLEGVPLAVELAAARAQVLSPAQILEQLQQGGLDVLTHRGRKMLARHRSLRETIAWSYHLLSPDLQHALARLSVFRGGWDVAAAEAVSQSDCTLDVLAQLCDASLVQAHSDKNEGVRFTVLETIRLFADEQLSDADRDDAGQCHAAYFRGMAQQAAPLLEQGDPSSWLDRLEDDEENLYVALDRHRKDGSFDQACFGLRFATDLYRFWMVRGNLSEGRRQLRSMLDRVPERAVAPPDEVALRATALNRLGVLAMRQRDHEEALCWLEAARAARLQSGETSGMAATLNNLAIVASELGKYPQAIRYYEESLVLWRSLGNERHVFTVLDNLGVLTLDSGDPVRAETLLAESLAGAERLGDRHSTMVRRRNLGEALYRQRQWAKATQYFRMSLQDAHAMKETRGCAYCLHDLAFVLAEQGGSAQAAALRDAALIYYSAYELSLSAFARTEESRLFPPASLTTGLPTPSDPSNRRGDTRNKAAEQRQADSLVFSQTQKVLAGGNTKGG